VTSSVGTKQRENASSEPPDSTRQHTGAIFRQAPERSDCSGNGEKERLRAEHERIKSTSSAYTEVPPPWSKLTARVVPIATAPEEQPSANRRTYHLELA
jgi:hypothetical protein